jgi:hypothetical protein
MAEFIYVRNFKELVAYQVAFDLSRRVFEVSKSFCSSSRIAEASSGDGSEWEDPLITDN